MIKKPKHNGFGIDKFPHQINAKFTDEDLKELEGIKNEFFGGDVSGSMLVRTLVRKGMEWYRERK